MDPIAHNRRLGLNLGDSISDESLVEDAKAKGTESARLILQLCYQRLRPVASTNIEKQLVGYIDDLAFAESKFTELDGRHPEFSVADAIGCIGQKKEVLGDTFANYLLECFESLNNSDCPAETLAFRLRLAKGQGRSTEFERKMEIAQSVKLILEGLKSGVLLRHATSYLAGESKRLPIYIETLYRLHGIPSLAGYDSDVRLQLAETIRDQYRPLIRKRLAEIVTKISSTGRKSSLTAADIYVESTKATAQLVKLAMDDSRISDADRADLIQLLDTLNSYGAAGRVPGKRGIQGIYKQNRNKLPTGPMRLIRHLSLDESRRLLDESRWLLAKEDPIVRQALDIIRSPDVGNHNRVELLKLEKQTPKEHQWIWHSEIWQDFESALARTVNSQVST